MVAATQWYAAVEERIGIPRHSVNISDLVVEDCLPIRVAELLEGGNGPGEGIHQKLGILPETVDLGGICAELQTPFDRRLRQIHPPPGVGEHPQAAAMMHFPRRRSIRILGRLERGKDLFAVLLASLNHSESSRAGWSTMLIAQGLSSCCTSVDVRSAPETTVMTFVLLLRYSVRATPLHGQAKPIKKAARQAPHTERCTTCQYPPTPVNFIPGSSSLPSAKIPDAMQCEGAARVGTATSQGLNFARGRSALIGSGASISGPVTVQAGGALEIDGAHITGPLKFSGAAQIRVCNTTITGPTTVTGAGGLVTFGDGTVGSYTQKLWMGVKWKAAYLPG
jgi:hypothetical protein